MRKTNPFSETAASGRVVLDLGDGTVLDTDRQKSAWQKYADDKDTANRSAWASADTQVLTDAKGYTDQEKWRRGALTANTDWNTVTTPGYYENAPWSVSSTQLNSATTLTGGLYVMRQGSYLLQIQYTGAAANGDPANVFYRSQVIIDGATTWSPWKSHLTEAKNYAVSQSNTALASAKTYTDEKLAALPPFVVPARSDLAVTIATGDSLTDGGSNGTLWPEEDTWVAKLDAQLETTITNYGFTGATVDEMLLRVGAIDVYFTPSGGALTLGGTTALTTTRKLGTYPSRRFTVAGKLAGKTGLLEFTTSDTWNFINYDTAGTFPVTGAAQFVPDWTGKDGASWVVMIGRNDVTAGVKGNETTVADHVVAGVQQLMDWLSPRAPRVMLTGVTTRTTEYTGSTEHDAVTEINTRLRALYPGRFKSIQDFLTDPATLTLAGITPTAEDNTALANGTIPPSLMDVGDSTHFSKATATLLANEFYKPYMLGRGWR